MCDQILAIQIDTGTEPRRERRNENERNNESVIQRVKGNKEKNRRREWCEAIHRGESVENANI